MEFKECVILYRDTTIQNISQAHMTNKCIYNDYTVGELLTLQEVIARLCKCCHMIVSHSISSTSGRLSYRFSLTVSVPEIDMYDSQGMRQHQPIILKGKMHVTLRIDSPENCNHNLTSEILINYAKG